MEMNFKHNRLTQLFELRYPIVQAGMVWCSGWRLAAAVSRAGGLGIIGSGSMYPAVLREHIRKCRAATDRPFAVNIPMLYPDLDAIVEIVLQEDVGIVFTSAGNPKTYTARFKEAGMTVAHVVSSVKFAEKAQAAGVDAVVAEGFEAGGHNGRDETTTFCLLPMVRQAVDIPLIAAGGIGSGRALLAAQALGADGFQIGSLFAASAESSAHENFKRAIVAAREGDTHLTLKELGPVRLLKNAFYQRIEAAYQEGAGVDDLKALLGRGRAKKGMFEGDLAEGELEIGQVAGAITTIKPAAEIIADLVSEYDEARRALSYPPALG